MHFGKSWQWLCIFTFWSSSAWALPAAGQRGIVTSGSAPASQAGVEMLRQGGNAIDAAVATAFALAVAEPYMSGLGGGGFALVRHDGHVSFWDFRETAPKNATRDMYMKNGQPDAIASRDGATSAGIPGAVRGYISLQQRFGKLTREQVLAPAIRLATDGFLVDQRFIYFTTMRLDVMRQDPEIRRIFLIQDPQTRTYTVPPVGHRILQPELAAALRAIAKTGDAAFYEGDIAKKIVRDQEKRHGLITLDDLSHYQIRQRAPLIGTFRGRTIVTPPPPSSGGTILLTMLNIMETLPPNDSWHSPQAMHLFLEAAKHAYADRALLGDPDFVPHLKEILPNLLAKDRAALLAQVFDNTVLPSKDVMPGRGAQLPWNTTPVNTPSVGDNTTHLSTIDVDGNAVSMTTTINYAFGAGFVVEGTGIVMNDQMDDFSVAVGVPNAYGIAGSAANAVAAGKVPLSSMAPTMIFDGTSTLAPLKLVIGSPGGSRIPTTVALAIVNFLDYGMDIENAITAGRVHHQHLPDVVYMEPHTLDPMTVNALTKMGHQIETKNPWCNATGIAIDIETGLRTGAADRRGTGAAIAE